MKNLKISMLGAGSGFVLSIAKELLAYDICRESEFFIMDMDPARLKIGENAVREILSGGKHQIKLVATTDTKQALDGSDYVITSCEMNRYANWVKDLRIPARHGVHQIKGENGGPGGLIHGLRNIGMFQGILADMETCCPDAWLMNFTNPMSILCTYFKNYSKQKALGFCHQVHGSFGVIAEELGMPPGELEVVSGGINHLNWLFDVRRKGTGKSCLAEFLAKVRQSKYWKEKFHNIPGQAFTLEVLNAFNMYPVGYDDHIIEYLPFFWEESEWKQHDCESLADMYEDLTAHGSKTLETMRLLGKEFEKPPFPVDPDHAYYSESPCQVINALETNTPQYFDAINIVNHGAISNLPSNAIVDVPALAIGGMVRSIYVGELPIGPMEICRRQITLHEMIAQAGHDGDDSLVIQALCLDPYVRSLTQARNIWADFRKEYKEYLPMFK